MKRNCSKKKCILFVANLRQITILILITHRHHFYFIFLLCFATSLLKLSCFVCVYKCECWRRVERSKDPISKVYTYSQLNTISSTKVKIWFFFVLFLYSPFPTKISQQWTEVYTLKEKNVKLKKNEGNEGLRVRKK